ncbi:MAG: hypothetical protein E7475_06940 [Ruminococcaceae bacterium]|nr:hypothetical protein [Oscillospiraceae bacterium]
MAAAGIGVATTAVTALSKVALDSYADYEQLVGGVETLFKTSADVVKGYADEAYKTAGMSANEYMETVTSFSASLLQGLGGDTAAAAEVANQAIVDMSDNANKMGTDMSMIQNAYQGFAKQNYTMLDNLKLGYGGTQAEMARLINDSGVLGDTITVTAETVNQVSFDQIIEAIHVVQTEMGITGTTALEASSTIAGSIDSMKAAWANLVTGLGDANADIDVLLDQFLQSVVTVGENLLPVVGNILNHLLTTIEERGPDMLAEGVLLLGKLALGLIQAIPELVSKVPEIISSIVQAFSSRSYEFDQIGQNIIQGIGNGLSSLAGWLYDKAASIVSSVVSVFTSGWDIHSPSRLFRDKIAGNAMFGLADGFVDYADEAYDAAEEVATGLQNRMEIPTASYRNSGDFFGTGRSAAGGLIMYLYVTITGSMDDESAERYGKIMGEKAAQELRAKGVTA